MPATDAQETWTLVSEDRQAVIAALKRGECEGILPAASGFMDEFAEFLAELGMLEQFDRFPDPRERHSIARAFFCNVLLHKALFRLPSLSQVGRVLFQSPDVLRKLGFNFRQINEGFYKGEGRKPFDEEALADFFAEVDPETLLEHQVGLSAHLLEQRPELLTRGVALLDCISVTVPHGHQGRAGVRYKVCVLALWDGQRLYPLLWHFTERGTGGAGDLTQGKLLVATARRAWGDGVLRRLIVDAGFIDGAWISELHSQGVGVVIKLREDMSMFEDMLGLARLQDAVWLPARSPQLHTRPRPRRELCCVEQLESWEACTAPLHGCVIRDTYADRMQYQCVVSTDARLAGSGVHEALRERWQIEEGFMDLTRYWNLERFGSCRPRVAAAQVHFTLLAYTLLHLFETEREPPARPPLSPLLLAGRELVVYWADYYAILLPSELFAIVFAHLEAWTANLDTTLAALRFCEGSLGPRGPT